MARKLSEMLNRVDDNHTRAESLIEAMGKINDQNYNPSVGAFSVYSTAVDLYGEMAQQDDVDLDELMRMPGRVEEARQHAVNVSKAYADKLPIVQALMLDLKQIQNDCDAVIAEKKKKIRKSKSLDGLEALSKQLDSLTNELAKVVSEGPHRPTSKALQPMV